MADPETNTHLNPISFKEMTERGPKISVVIPSYNRANAIKLTLQYLLLQTLPADSFEVIVVDDGSLDNTMEVTSTFESDLNILYIKQLNQGAAAARNRGASFARSTLLLFLDVDVIPEKNLLQSHIKTQALNQKTLIVGRVQPWSEIPQCWIDLVVDPETAAMDYGNEAMKLPFYMTLGGNLSITKAAFDKIGGYDESFPAAGAEETEFAYRAEKFGYLLSYLPEAIGYHNHMRTLWERIQQQKYHMRSMALLLSKHPETQSKIYGVDDLMPIFTTPVGASSVYRRIRASFFGIRIIRFTNYLGLVMLNRLRIWPKVTSILYWRLYLGARHAGFREGLRLYTN